MDPPPRGKPGRRRGKGGPQWEWGQEPSVEPGRWDERPWEGGRAQGGRACASELSFQELWPGGGQTPDPVLYIGPSPQPRSLRPHGFPGLTGALARPGTGGSFRALKQTSSCRVLGATGRAGALSHKGPSHQAGPLPLLGVSPPHLRLLASQTSRPSGLNHVI